MSYLSFNRLKKDIKFIIKFVRNQIFNIQISNFVFPLPSNSSVPFGLNSVDHKSILLETSIIDEEGGANPATQRWP